MKMKLITSIIIAALSFSLYADEVIWQKYTPKIKIYSNTRSYVAIMPESELYLDVSEYGDWNLTICLDKVYYATELNYWLTSKDKRIKVNSREKLFKDFKSDISSLLKRGEDLTKVFSFELSNKSKIFTFLTLKEKKNCILHIQPKIITTYKNRMIYDIDLEELFTITDKKKGKDFKLTRRTVSPAEFKADKLTSTNKFNCVMERSRFTINSSIFKDKNKYGCLRLGISNGLLESSHESVYSFYNKTTEFGKKLTELLNDGEKHEGTCLLKYAENAKEDWDIELIDFTKYIKEI